MKNRTLGQSSLVVAPLALGGNVFGWTIDEPTSFAVLDAFIDGGFNLIDTANIYSTWVPGHQGGESENIIGRWLQRSGKRDKVVLATKVGMAMGDGSKGLKKDYILQSFDASLRRLQTDYVDLYQSHQEDPDTPLDETLSAYDHLLRQGKVRAIGASNYSAARLAEALTKSPQYVSLQPEYNLYQRVGFEKELEPLCLRRNVGVISYFSLASGFLTGKYRSAADAGLSARGGGIVKKYLNERGLRILAALDQVAAEHHTVPAVIALAWLIARPSVTAPIASATSVAQLHELAQSAHIRLSSEQIATLDAASAE